MKIEKIVDDFDHESDAETHTFEYEGTRYEVDLADHNVNELHEAQERLKDARGLIESFVRVARPVSPLAAVPDQRGELDALPQDELDERLSKPRGAKTAKVATITATRKKPRRRKSKGSTDVDTVVVNHAEVRAWANEQDIEVSPTGRVPASIIERYLANSGQK